MAAAALARPGPRHRPSQRSGRALHPPRVPAAARSSSSLATRVLDRAFRPGHHHAAIWLPALRNIVPCRWRWPVHILRKKPTDEGSFSSAPSTAPSFDDHWRAEQHWRVDEEDVGRRSAKPHRPMREGRRNADRGRQPANPTEVKRAVADAIAGSRHKWVGGKVPRYLCLLQDADEIHVTADSVSMLSEAIFTGKPVGMIPIRPALRGTVSHALANMACSKHPSRICRPFGAA